ncbi:type II toxin-antitoxin system PemK/MazF family toxin [Synechococcales cyanobacterium C]|uniref:Type II toxin-antitoxin system PemK/MazF family toxin n=1 Tax=Petrachloros mirabilis ULC683 TaxID=2781853 RepID=A0A8K1ZWV2_9CYAN|nr:type II toxin-antitoxin system PemK/MazF family toxin [Petrachloros mirabilis]NCJ05357.1 type II toxin-antitoxin system PemK/MazF family toxin [Petrachloros mirabilis ULC683]
MTTYDFADVLLVPFPFTDQSTTKKRPTVVISSGSYNTMRPDLILIAVTSQITSPLLFGELEITNWQNAGLLKVSVIKPVLTTIAKELIIRKLGRLQVSDRERLERLLKSILCQ